MINLIEEKTSCKLTIGQNGSILLRGTDESISKSKDALNLIGKNAHLSNLNDKVISLISK